MPRSQIDASYILNAAFHYLGRFSSSEANLRKTLTRKIQRRKKKLQEAVDIDDHTLVIDIHSLTEEEEGWIEEAVTKCRDYGYVDDHRYAEQRAQNLLLRGKPPRQIKQDLKHKGIAEDIIAIALAKLERPIPCDQQQHWNADLFAAVRYIKRRRLGAFSAVGREKPFEKQLASMARAGFSYEISKQVLALSLERLMDIIDSTELR